MVFLNYVFTLFMVENIRSSVVVETGIVHNILNILILGSITSKIPLHWTHIIKKKAFLGEGLSPITTLPATAEYPNKCSKLQKFEYYNI